jgi:hypothetical protein
VIRRLLAALLADRQPPARPAAKVYQWRCPCGASGRDRGHNQWMIESNADQHWLRAGQPHPLPYVSDQDGNIVSRRLRGPSGTVGRHWGWTD